MTISAKTAPSDAVPTKLSEEDMHAAARKLVETSTDLIAENAKLARELVRADMILEQMAAGLEKLAGKLDEDLRKEALALSCLADAGRP